MLFRSGGHEFILDSGCKLQGLQALSSTESELIQLTNAVKEIVWFQPQVESVTSKEIETEIMEDNRPVIDLVLKGNTSGRTKYLDVKVKFVMEALKEKKFVLRYVPTIDNVADIITKSLPLPRLRYLREKLLKIKH